MTKQQAVAGYFRVPIASGNNNLSLKGRVVIDGVSQEEVDYIRKTSRVCGECKFFDLRRGQELIQKNRFIERIQREEGWDPRFLGSPPHMLGVCRAHGGSSVKAAGECITGLFHRACDQFVSSTRALLRRGKNGIEPQG